MNDKILIADDDPILLRLLSDMMKKQNYTPILAEDGQKALDIFFEDKEISLCILDVMMPQFTGYEVLETIREHSEVPIIILTAQGEENNELQGFRQGANDFISKPFSYPILMARVEAILNKERKSNEKPFVEGGLTLDLIGRTLSIENEFVTLNNKEFSLLTFFVKNKSIALSREQLLAKVWGYDYEGEIRTVDTHVKMLRKKLGPCEDYIVTVRGVGYKFQVSD